MAYDTELADRIRALLSGEPDITEKRMFGGLAFLTSGRMAVAASGRSGAMVRIDPADADDLTTRPGVSRMVMRGREMDGWLRVEDAALDAQDDLEEWVERGLAFARTLPPK